MLPMAMAWSSSGSIIMLRISGLVDDIMFSYNGPKGGVMLLQQYNI